MNHLFKATDESYLGGGCLLNFIMHGWWKIDNWPCQIGINENIVKWVSYLVPKINAPSRIGSTLFCGYVHNQQVGKMVKIIVHLLGGHTTSQILVKTILHLLVGTPWSKDWS